MQKLIILLLCIQFIYAENGDHQYFSMKKEAYYDFEHNMEAKALHTVQVFLKKYPYNTKGKNLLAVFYYWQGEINKAKSILENIVKTSDYKPAKTLLAKINASTVQSTTKTSDISNDLEFLLQEIHNKPDDIVDRKYLVHYYVSIKDQKKAQQMALEVLAMNPDDVDMLSIINAQKSIYSDSYSKIQRDKIMDTLDQYYKCKEYVRYLNLYSALQDNLEYIPTYVHVNALETAIEVKAYKVAKKIIMKTQFPSSAYLMQVKKLLDQKLNMASLDIY